MMFLSLGFFLVFFLHFCNYCKNMVTLKISASESSGDFRFLSTDIMHLIAFMVLVLITVLLAGNKELYVVREMFVCYIGGIVIANLTASAVNRWIKTTIANLAVFVGITSLYFVLVLFTLPFKL